MNKNEMGRLGEKSVAHRVLHQRPQGFEAFLSFTQPEPEPPDWE